MSEHDEKKLNNQDAELAQLRSLVGDVREGDYSLDDILSEFSPRSRPKNLVSLSQEPDGIEPDSQPEPTAPEDIRDASSDGELADNVVLFPGTQPPSSPVDEPEMERDAAPARADEDGEIPGDESDSPMPDNVVQFPDRKFSLSGLIRSLSQRANKYAEGMFEDEDMPSSPETRRMEELIPGVDRETHTPRARRARRQDPPLPDTPPQQLAREYGKGLKGLHIRSALLCFLTLLAFYLVLEPMLPIPSIPSPFVPGQPLLSYSVKAWAGAVLLAGALALSWDVLANTVRRLAQHRVGMDTLLLFACVFTLADAVTAPWVLPRQEQPYCAINILALALSLQGEHHRRRGLRLACRAAAASAQPYLVTLDDGKWNGRDTYTKHAGTVEGFGRQIQADDGAQRLFRVVCPVVLLGGTLVCVLTCLMDAQLQRLLWSLSAVLTCAATLSAPLVFSRPFHRVSRRLVQSGGALAGWPAVAESRRGNGILLTDLDLFPPGAVTLNGFKVFGSYSRERVIAYTATLIRASHSGLDRLFSDLLRTQGGILRQADRLCCYEGGGLSANIRGDQVLVGSASFMTLMEIELPQGLQVKTAVFCAIDGELAGIFALHYTLPDTIFPSVSSLFQERLSPVLATRDFNITPGMLWQRFRLATDRMDFPPVERRRELSDPEQSHSTTLTAVLCREGIVPFSESVVAARRLRRAVRVNAVLACLASLLGAVLACYLTAVGAFASISPLSVLVYLMLWLLPSWFLTGWVDQF